METRLDPIIAVRDVSASRDWYRSVFAWQSLHDGDEFAVLADEQGEIQLCLHRWGAHEHPTMKDADLALNPNSRQQEFALRDLDGYFLIVSEFHTY